MEYTQSQMGTGAFAVGTLPSATPVVVPMGGAPLPATITLKSADAGRLIEFSSDGGVEYFTPTPDVTSATMQVVAAKFPISHVRLTGASGDKWSVR